MAENNTTDARTMIKDANPEKGQQVTVAYRPSPNQASETLEGEVVAVYTTGKFAILPEGEDKITGTSYIVQQEGVRKGSFREGHTEEIGRGIFVEAQEAEQEEQEQPPEDAEEQTLTFTHTTHGAHEGTGQSYTREEEKEHTVWEVSTEGDRVRYKTEEYDGFFILEEDGQVLYDPPGDSRAYEAGTSGSVN